MRNQGKCSDLKSSLPSFHSTLLNPPSPAYLLNLEGTMALSNDTPKLDTEFSPHWDQIFNQINICLWSVEVKTMKTLQISAACKSILGYSQQELIHNAYLWEELLHPSDKDQVLHQLHSIENGQPAKLEYRIRTPFGGHKWIFDYITPIYDEHQVLLRYDRVIMDIDHQKRTEEELKYLAFHDFLTGLPNRRKFNEELQRALGEAKRKNYFVGVLFIDIDRFKDINDSLGHKMGDIFIQTMAKRLKENLRSDDLLSRQGGDEFVILLKDLPDRHVIDQMAMRISRVISEPIKLLDHEYRLSVSIGTSIFPDHGQEADVLMMRADHAMYLAKENKMGIQQYQIGMSKSLSRKMLLEQYLHRAIEKNELYLVYQPIIDIQMKQVIGLEALLRWRHPVLGNVSPCEFIQIAEESDLIIKLSNWVLFTCCRQRRRWIDQGLAPFYISINVPARQIHQDNFIETIKCALKQYKLPAIFLKIEITERTAMTNVEKTLKTMRELQEFGVDIILDDFGIGYSSISYLVQYPFNTIKIDKSFIQNLNHSSNQKSVCRSLVTMGKNLGMNVVAEGVEELEQYHYLCSIGCHKMQGYYFSKPISIELVESVTNQIRTWNIVN
ncbi:sensor domain-containing protein [Neobacillus cucumis]|uniref:Response regulator receiver protein n=1 Tax=Neobacillus cucumis TaxID=1740721 RepID=A0A2N5H758_9BACI|nr:GGDEF and EAL domain-containing protein [Neobacillus cucumis]PLS01355.1 response regulator receiver protein [Neobacillus cucumis]